jgi:hypothetical protein
MNDNNRWSLAEILDHETGDSWNGTHGRHIFVDFDPTGWQVTVTSSNSLFPGDDVVARFSLNEVESALGENGIRAARYYSAFILLFSPRRQATMQVREDFMQQARDTRKAQTVLDRFRRQGKSAPRLRPGK